MTLPPGQRAVEGFPRFGTHLHHPPPPIPADPAIEVGGEVTEPVRVTLEDLKKLPRREQASDFHCVSGWSATGLRWEGVPFATFYREVIEPILRPGARITRVIAAGLDGYESVLRIEDALAEDVLIADTLDGSPLPLDHGAPIRLVSPGQYGFMSTKHLCRIEVGSSRPQVNYGATSMSQIGLKLIGFKYHPRSRVWPEERHAFIPGPVLRPFYRALIAPIRMLSARGSRR